MKQETYDKWKSIIDSYDPSKETAKDYCLKKSLTPSSDVFFFFIIDHLTHYSYEYLFEVHLCAQ